MTTPMFATLVAREPDATRPDMTAQRLELIGRFAAYHATNTFAPGDLVAQKPGLSMFRPDGQKTHALLFWRWLDVASSVDILLIQHAIKSGDDIPDCTVAILSDSAGCVSFLRADSRNLRPLDPDERAALEHVLAHDGVAT